jgi:3-isopropylmalate/(R)-2-methylmalate dehydratase large subunit
MAQTLFNKIWQQHLIDQSADGAALIYIDGQLLHEVTSPQAFEGIAQRGLSVRRPDACLATPDHNVATDRGPGELDAEADLQLNLLNQNCGQWGIECFPVGNPRQGIVHVVGPEQGFTLPGMTLVCGDSHTATHGAFGALAFGIGTAEVEHVLATQSLWQQPQKNMRIQIDGRLNRGISAKDLIMFIVGKVGTAGATGYVVEYAGSIIETLSMEARMTL